MIIRWRPVALLLAVAALTSLTALAALLSNGTLLASTPAGLGDPGKLTRYGLPLAVGLRDLTAALTVGALAIASTLMASTDRTATAVTDVRRHVLGVAGIASAGWACCAVVVLLLNYSELAGVSPLASGFYGSLSSFVKDFPSGRALLANAVVAGGTCVAALLSRSHTAAYVLAIIAVTALLPLASTGHAAGEGSHDAAVYVQLLHTAAMSLWVGGLATLLLCHRSLMTADWVTVVGRYSSIAGWSVLVLVLSGVGAAIIRLEGWSDMGTAYGLLIIGKSAALALLVLTGYWQRRRILPALRSALHQEAHFRRLAYLELAVMGLAVGLAVALSRTAPPEPSEQTVDAYSAEQESPTDRTTQACARARVSAAPAGCAGTRCTE